MLSPGGIVQGGGLIDIKEFARQGDVDKVIDRAYVGIALSAALVTAKPAPGDRFSASFNVAEYRGEVGGGMALGFAPSEKILINIGIATSGDSHLARGGISFSF